MPSSIHFADLTSPRARVLLADDNVDMRGYVQGVLAEHFLAKFRGQAARRIRSIGLDHRIDIARRPEKIAALDIGMHIENRPNVQLRGHHRHGVGNRGNSSPDSGNGRVAQYGSGC